MGYTRLLSPFYKFAIDLEMGALCFAEMQLAQAPAFTVGKGDLRDVEHDPVVAHVRLCSGKFHLSHPFVTDSHAERPGIQSVCHSSAECAHRNPAAQMYGCAASMAGMVPAHGSHPLDTEPRQGRQKQ
ncbi:hypothetical protein ACJA3S_11030 [Pseudomonas sp. KnCO4]|uniref:hypothetical protein n=1 Tax=Pseudomonas sp. KnCO4 TaxID=3381355 RepID=UPI003877DEBE